MNTDVFDVDHSGGEPPEGLHDKMHALALTADPGALDLPRLSGRAAARRRRSQAVAASTLLALAVGASGVVLGVGAIGAGGDRLEVADSPTASPSSRPSATASAADPSLPERARLRSTTVSAFPDAADVQEFTYPAGPLGPLGNPYGATGRTLITEGLGFDAVINGPVSDGKGGEYATRLNVFWSAIDPPLSADGPQIDQPGRPPRPRVPLPESLSAARGVRAVAYRIVGQDSLAVVAWTPAGGLVQLRVVGIGTEANGAAFVARTAGYARALLGDT